jgi:serine/threonine protein kinase
MGRLLGQGAFAMVREATHIESGHVVAIKIYDKYKLNSNAQTKKSVQREIKMLSLITKTSLETLDGHDFISINEDEIEGHPSIMKLYDAIDYQRHLYLVTESCKGKMLSTIVREYRGQG